MLCEVARSLRNSTILLDGLMIGYNRAKKEEAARDLSHASLIDQLAQLDLQLPSR